MSFAWRFNQPSEPNAVKFKFNNVSELEVLKHLRKLKRKCATGLDNLPSCYLKDIAYVLAKPLTHVINLSLQSGTFPTDLKKARVTPIYKSGTQNIFDNYRPISVLPVISKVFEKCVHAQITNHLESNKLLSENQFGFRKYLSTEIATAYFTDQIRKAMDNGYYVGAVYIDLSKAFDTISHSILFNTLPEYGISGRAQDWLCDYLFSRSQQVSFQGKLSSAEPIFCGVPQGSILGPLLFILYFNNAIKTLSQCKMLMYADDTVLFCSGKDVGEIQKQLNADFQSFASWLDKNELVINTKKGKTEVMVFGTSQKLNKLEETPIQIMHRNKEIHNTKTYKYLGLNLTCNLNMSDHLNESIKKASARLHLLKKIRAFMDRKTSTLVYQTMITPLLTYCSFSLYGATSPYLKQKIERIESRAEKIIGQQVQRNEMITMKRICTYVHKCLHSNNVGAIFDSYFTMKNSTVNTRNNGTMINIPRINLEIARASFYYQGASLFNKLPKEIRAENDFISFKKKLKSFYTLT